MAGDKTMSAIPIVRPISELKNTTGISNLCHEVKEPIFITKNGHIDLVIMSVETYERTMNLSETISVSGSKTKKVSNNLSSETDDEIEDF